MASIQIPDEEYRRLTERAQAAGYADVSAFISALAGEAEEGQTRPVASDPDQQSHDKLVALIEEGLQGETVSVEEAEARIQQKIESIANRSEKCD